MTKTIALGLSVIVVACMIAATVILMKPDKSDCRPFGADHILCKNR